MPRPQLLRGLNRSWQRLHRDWTESKPYLLAQVQSILVFVAAAVLILVSLV